MTVKAWKKFGDEAQKVLLEKHDVILTDHQTRREKAVSILKKFNKKNMDKGIDKFNAGVKSFSDAMKQIHFDPSGIDPIEGTWGKKPNLPDTKSLMWGSRVTTKEKDRPRKKSRKTKSRREPDTKELFWGRTEKDKNHSRSLHL